MLTSLAPVVAEYVRVAQQLKDPDSGLAHGELQLISNLDGVSLKALFNLGCTGKPGSCFETCHKSHMSSTDHPADCYSDLYCQLAVGFISDEPTKPAPRPRRRSSKRAASWAFS